MRMVRGRVTHYRSINDSNLVEFDPKITSIVGVTGSGKTSFLRMLSGVSGRVQFGEVDLPHKSDILARFHDGVIGAGEIQQLHAEFEVEDVDRPLLPPEHRDSERIEVSRSFDGSIKLKVDGQDLPRANIGRHTEAMAECASRVARLLYGTRLESPEDADAYTKAIDDAVTSFNEANFHNLNDATLAINALKTAAHSVPCPRSVMTAVDAELEKIESVWRDIRLKLRNDPSAILYRAIPKPRYSNKVFELEDEIDLDRFIKDPYSSRTFAYVAQICGLAPAGLSRVRNARAAERDGYLETKSAILSTRLNQFWRQENYTFKLSIDGRRLRLHVSDRTTGTTTSLTERSDGFRWWMSFFLDLSAYLAPKSGRSVILLDNPATELHEKGKGDVLHFIQEVAKSDRIQIIYSTHERALIDPWHTDRIRVADLTSSGTKIKTVTAASSNGMLETIMTSIGSPAHYSLFGAPRTVVFEGASDMHIASAMNEYISMTDPGASLDRDVYSINSMGGADKARYTHRIYESLGVDFIIVLDRGPKSAGIRSEIGSEKFTRRFVEIQPLGGGSEADIEDLVDRDVYYEAFRLTYAPILGTIPPIDEIDGDAGQRRAVNYRRWFAQSAEGKFSKTLVSQRMFDVVKAWSDDPDGGTGKALERTAKAFVGLFNSIKAKYDGEGGGGAS